MNVHLVSVLISVFVGVQAKAWNIIQKNSNTFYSQLAQYHAPIVHQHLGGNPVADQITRMDFDGDFIANNNWDNLDHYTTPAYVYYSVIESESHYFISYSFFHPRDYSRVCFMYQCHENDLEGIIITVFKDGSAYGRFSLLETMAHDKIYTYRQPHFINQRVAIYIERHGHGIKAWDIKKRGPLNGENFLSGKKPTVTTESGQNISAENLLVYIPNLRADNPNGARGGEFSYQLLNVEGELWNRQNLWGRGSLWMNSWNYKGVRGFVVKDIAGGFAGEKYTTGRARPPWAWVDNGESVLKKGDWFLDPAHYVARRLKLSEPISEKYIYNPYLEMY